jgi:HK97 family phage major capsid protein
MENKNISTIEIQDKNADGIMKELSDVVESGELSAETKEVVEKMIDDAIKKRRQEDEQQRLKEIRKTSFEVEDDKKSPLITGNLNDIIYKSSTDPQIIELQKKSDEIYLLATILKVSPTETKLWKDFLRLQSKLSKAMATATTGAGAEWIPTGFSAELTDRVRLELRVAALHTRVPMPTNPYKSPVVSADAVGYLVPEVTTSSPVESDKVKASTPGTKQATFVAKKLGARVLFSEELNEDSIIPILPFLRENIITALATSQETATINGDESATHMDADVTDSKDARKAWKGYRKLAHPDAKLDLGGTLSQSKLRTIRKNMKKYGVDVTKLCWVVGVSGLAHLLALNKAENNRDVFITPDRYGANITPAMRVPGEQGRIDTVPVIVSEHIREDLNALGVYDGTTTTQTIIVLIYRPALQYGDRRGVTVKMDENIETDQTVLVATQRVAFEEILDSSTERIVGLGYNLTA